MPRWEHMAPLQKQLLIKQQSLIAQQNALLQAVRKEGTPCQAQCAERLLAEMLKLRATMCAELERMEGAANEPATPLDEKSLEHVMREAPL